MRPLFIKATILACLALCGTATKSSGQCDDFASLLGYEEVYIQGFERDNSGNLFVTGMFMADQISVGNVSLTRMGAGSIFLLKFDKNLSALWGRVAGNDGIDWGTAIDIDHNGDVIMSGYFFSSSITFGCTTLFRYSRQELFVVKYTTDGDFLWAIGTERLQDGWSANLKVTNTNSIALSSIFLSGNMTLGGKSIPGSPGANGYDSFVASISSSGEVAWIKSFGGQGNYPDYILDIDVDLHGNIGMTGFFESPVMTFDQIQLPVNTISENLFVAKLDPAGGVLWAKGSGGAADNGGFGISFDDSGNVYVTGRFYPGITSFDNLTLENKGEMDIYVVRYDANGNAAIARSFGDAGSEAGQQIKFDNAGTLVIAGFFLVPRSSLISIPWQMNSHRMVLFPS